MSSKEYSRFSIVEVALSSTMMREGSTPFASSQICMASPSVIVSPGPWPPETTATQSGCASSQASAASRRLRREREGTSPCRPAPRTTM